MNELATLRASIAAVDPYDYGEMGDLLKRCLSMMATMEGALLMIRDGEPGRSYSGSECVEIAEEAIGPPPPQAQE